MISIIKVFIHNYNKTFIGAPSATGLVKSKLYHRSYYSDK